LAVLDIIEERVPLFTDMRKMCLVIGKLMFSSIVCALGGTKKVVNKISGLFCCDYFRDGVLQTIYLGLAQTTIFLISATQAKCFKKTFKCIENTVENIY
jgi:hypothetical protein